MHDATTFLELADEILSRDERIFLAYDARQAFQLMRHLGGAVAVIDLDSKAKDGLSLMRRLREGFPDLPVIVISSVLGVP
jgi:DNA-binding NarL/FixJ family response regulator